MLDHYRSARIRGIGLLCLAAVLTACAIPLTSNPNPPLPTAPLPAGVPTVPPAVPAVDPFVAEVNETLAARYPDFSGTLLIARDGRLRLNQGYGFADRENSIPNTPYTKFRIGSLTKAFTAMGIMILEERGRLSVQDSICRYVADCPEAWESITLHHLLTHTSGIPDYTVIPDAEKRQAIPLTPSELIHEFKSAPLEFAPGTAYNYNNSGYVLLGYVIEQVYGTSYETFLRENIWKPLAMRNTGYDHSRQILPGRASGYSMDGDTLIHAAYLDMSLAYAAGGLYSTVEDLYRWDQALYTQRLVSQATLDRIFAPQVPTPEPGIHYGYGWFVTEENGRELIFHTGQVPGFHALLVRSPGERATIIILSNHDTTDLEGIGRDLGALVELID